MARDSKHAVEKEQALKLIRSLVEIGTQRRSPSDGAGFGASSVPLSESVIRAIVAVAEHGEDHFRFLSLLTLAEIGSHNPVSVIWVVLN